MNDGEKSLTSEIKNIHLHKKIKKKRPKIRYSAINLVAKDLEIKEKPKKLHLFKFPTSLNVLSYNTENNDNYTTDNSNNNLYFPKYIRKKQSTKYIRNLVTKKILSSSSKKNKNNNNLYNIFENKSPRSINKITSISKISSFQIYDYNSINNSVFISHHHPVNVKSCLRSSSKKEKREIFQKIVSLDIFSQSNINNKSPKKQISSINYSYFPEKTQNINNNLNLKDVRKKRRRFYPSVKMFNIKIDKLNLNEPKNKFLNSEDDELSKKTTSNFSPYIRRKNYNKKINNINSYNYKGNNYINSICKPSIINDISAKNKNEYNTFSTNFYSVREYKNLLTERNLIRPIKKKKISIYMESDDDCRKLKMKLLTKNLTKNKTNKNDYLGSFADKNNDKLVCRKKEIMNLKNNIQFFNKYIANNKLNDDNKIKHKISLFPSSNYLLKNEQLKKEEKKSDKNSENKENNTDDFENSSDDSCSSKRKKNFNFISNDESKLTIKKNNKYNIINGSDKSNKSEKNNKKDNISNNKYSNEENEKSEDNENLIKKYLKGKKLKENKFWNLKYDDENQLRKKKLSKIKSQLKKISKESYVFNTRKKEIENNFIQNNIIENVTKKIIDTFGLKFLEEENADKIIQKKLLIDEKNKPSKETLKNTENNELSFHMIKIYKLLYTKKITIKYNFNLLRAQEILNIYETHLLKLTDKVWNKVNEPYDYSMEMINYICNKKEVTNCKKKNSDKILMSYCLDNKEKSVRYLKEKKLKKKILKTDQYFFKELEIIKKDLHLKTAYLHLRINLLNFKSEENDIKLKNKINLNNTSNKKLSFTDKKCNELEESYASISKKEDSLKTISNLKNHSVINLHNKNKISLSRGNSLTKQSLDNDLNNKTESLNLTKSSLFHRSIFRSNTKHLTSFSNKKEIINEKKTEEMEKEEKYKKDIEKKEKKLKKTEKSIIGLNILKNKFLFTKDYIENSIDAEKKISEIFKSRQKYKNLDKNNKTEAMIIKSCGYDSLSTNAALIKTQELENDLPNVKLFEKFVMLINERNFDLFEKYVNLEGDKFLKIINRRDLSSGNTMLHFAVENKLINFMKILLIKGANPNIQNNFGNSPLHLAYKFNSFFMINLLLEYNANKQLKNSEGLFPGQMSKFVNG